MTTGKTIALITWTFVDKVILLFNMLSRLVTTFLPRSMAFNFMAAITICGEVTAAAAKLLQSCLTPCDPIDGSPPGTPVPGILQARTLGVWVCLSIGGILSWSRLGCRGPRGAERTESSLGSPAPPMGAHGRARSPTALGTSCPRGACRPAAAHLQRRHPCPSVSVILVQSPPSACPRLHAWHCPSIL